MWSSYTGSSAIILAVLLFVVTGVLVYGGMRLSHPLAAKRPGLYLGVCIGVLWLLSLTTFLVAVTVYVAALINQLGHVTVSTASTPANPITPFTLLFAVVAFLVILYLTIPGLTSSSGTTARVFWVGVGSAVVGTIAAWTIFEFPYDLIVMWHTYPPTPHVLFTLLFFLPLFLFEFSSYAMLTFSPFTKLSRTTLFLLAGMFFIFAVWAVFGFAYPSAPLPYACNVIGKCIAFAIGVSLFLPRQKVHHGESRTTGESRQHIQRRQLGGCCHPAMRAREGQQRHPEAEEAG